MSNEVIETSAVALASLAVLRSGKAGRGRGNLSGKLEVDI